MKKYKARKVSTAQDEKAFSNAHFLCKTIVGVVKELLLSGERQGIFTYEFSYSDPEHAKVFSEKDDIFEALKHCGYTYHRDQILIRQVFPALLSDFIHFVETALECLLIERVTVSLSSIRKPIQEHLFLFEKIVISPNEFANQLDESPLRLRSTKAGGAEAVTKLIKKVLKATGNTFTFNPSYLAQIRYEKTDDSFDRLCNQAIHLFTENSKIRTENLNINMVFSGQDVRNQQKHFIYSRLPYVLFYAWRVIEHLCQFISITDPSYMRFITSKICASTIIWRSSIEERYQMPEFFHLAKSCYAYLKPNCLDPNKPKLDIEDLIQIRDSDLTQRQSNKEG